MADFIFLGAHPALDFVNTWTLDRGKPVERMADFAGLASFVRAASLLRVADLEVALRRWAAGPDAARVHTEAFRLREAIRGYLKDAAGSERLRVAINVHLGGPVPRVEVVPAGKGFAEVAWLDDAGPEVALRALASLASDLLCRVPREALACCEASDCVTWFVAAGETAHRVWCSDARCGNRTRTARWTARQKVERAGRSRR